MTINRCFVCTFVLLTVLISVDGDLDEILKLDRDVTIGSQVSPDQLFKYLTGGISQAFWQFVNSSDFDSLDSISPSCKHTLKIVKNGFTDLSMTSFQFIDSASKSPPGFMRAAVASFGDYDQCLSINDTINGYTLLGKYCAYDTHPVKFIHTNNSTFSFDRISVFQRIPFINSICVPSECDSVDTRLLISYG